jgi:ATP-dependent DNA helicase PIF1
MVHADVADTVERTLRDVMRNQRPFGGKTMVWMGDFKQLLPVVRYGKGQNHTIQQCSWWNQATKLTFTTNWRAVQNPEYTAFLETVGNGRVDSVVPPAECRCTSYDEIIENVYGDHFNSRNQILALTLDTCAEINRRCFAKLPGEIIERPAADKYVDCSDRDAFPPDYVQSLAMNGAPPWMLQFKPGAKYMCIRNLDPVRGIINGTMMKLLSVGRNMIQVQILTGKSAGSCDFLTRSVFTITSEASGLPFTILRSQFPIIPAYCLSVHKAQGQTLDTVGVVFESDPFTHGQLYVALSRVGGWQKVYTYYQGENIMNVVLRHLLP